MQIFNTIIGSSCKIDISFVNFFIFFLFGHCTEQLNKAIGGENEMTLMHFKDTRPNAALQTKQKWSASIV